MTGADREQLAALAEQVAVLRRRLDAQDQAWTAWREAMDGQSRIPRRRHLRLLASEAAELCGRVDQHDAKFGALFGIMASVTDTMGIGRAGQRGRHLRAIPDGLARMRLAVGFHVCGAARCGLLVGVEQAAEGIREVAQAAGEVGERIGGHGRES